MSHALQLGLLVGVGLLFAGALWRWKDEHPSDCLCERCRNRNCDRYIAELTADRERRDRANQVVHVDDFRRRRHG